MAQTSSLTPARASLIFLLLMGTFVSLSWLAVNSKSPTYDEPLHALAGWLHLRHHDFRIDPEDPPLWKYLAASCNEKGFLEVRLDSPAMARTMADVYYEWDVVHEMLYETPQNMEASDFLIRRSRLMMLTPAIVLGALIAWWSWKLGGAIAMVIATFAFAFDPNFLGHAALVKNDVSFTLAFLAAIAAAWSAGRRLTVANTAALAPACAAAINIKFSALILGPIVAGLLILRAMLGENWSCFGHALKSRFARLACAAGLCLLCGAASWLAIWACYGFRFGPSPDPSQSLSSAQMIEYLARNQLRASAGGREPTTQQLQSWQEPGRVKLLRFLEGHRLFPQAWIVGLLYTWGSALWRDAFLAGKVSATGWWYYFPFAILVKSPIALIVGAIGAFGVGISALRRPWRGNWTALWTAMCLFLPPAVYLAAAMASNLNIGLRHIFPVYPFIYIGIGLAAAHAWQLRPRLTRIIVAILAAGLAIESMSAFPDYIAFFNVAAGGARGGLGLLGDSNLDWGQDLKLLAHWQQRHPQTKLYLCYSGTADPWAYGIEYTNVPGGYPRGPARQHAQEPGVLAISASKLQHISIDATLKTEYGALRNRKPLEVLGGTIYLFDWPP
jgi:hypothetical protein